MIEISEGVYVDEDEIEAKYDDIIVMKDGVLMSTSPFRSLKDVQLFSFSFLIVIF